MDENKFELKIKTDKNGQEIDIHAMSIETVQKFMVLIEALTKIVELTPSNENITIKISNGSACVAAIGDEVSLIKENFEKVKENDPSVKQLFEPYRRLQQLFSLNGYSYEATQALGDNVISIYDDLKNSKFKSKREKKKFEFLPVFIEGYYFLGGGKVKKNIHVNPSDGSDSIIISCSAEQSRKSRDFLESTIHLSAWVSHTGDKVEYSFCDSYVGNRVFNELKTFIDSIRDEDELEALSKIHDTSREYLDNKKFGEYRKFMKLFLHESTDINILKEILLITKSLKEQEKIKDARKSMQEMFDKKLKSYKKTNPKNSWLQ